MAKLRKYIDDAVKNIEDDRAVTRQLLDDVIQLLAKNEENHKYVGQVAAKYVETLQRSNEQLVKVAGLIQKQDNSQTGLSDDDKNEIFNILQSDSNSKEEEAN
jgi:F0F1-type ATP synthase membrane subunit b/b'